MFDSPLRELGHRGESRSGVSSRVILLGDPRPTMPDDPFYAPNFKPAAPSVRPTPGDQRTHSYSIEPVPRTCHMILPPMADLDQRVRLAAFEFLDQQRQLH